MKTIKRVLFIASVVPTAVGVVKTALNAKNQLNNIPCPAETVYANKTAACEGTHKWHAGKHFITLPAVQQDSPFLYQW